MAKQKSWLRQQPKKLYPCRRTRRSSRSRYLLGQNRAAHRKQSHNSQGKLGESGCGSYLHSHGSINNQVGACNSAKQPAGASSERPQPCSAILRQRGNASETRGTAAGIARSACASIGCHQLLTLTIRGARRKGISRLRFVCFHDSSLPFNSSCRSRYNFVPGKSARIASLP